MKEVIVLMQEQNTTVRKKGQHLTSFERGRIATLHSQGYSNRAIARALNVGSYDGITDKLFDIIHHKGAFYYGN